ncbi:MAG: hypothetical protein UY01_C0004G0027 [Candidatus Nomurabacteria bacterium GW2011_GWB1_47_6]|uniref:Uncharacterized protein n=1 Tax=Candidatus Nomurabacteria bacterium GW2011_GWB1_47_6 TaxID=1618749 RepID=A0A0G1W0G8_9BACT|nr:MAG: hypothetical protein UY01_C0004G0027 [Candidatus Nomurabacteria bacterium GW2011_GWB1_47_6]
MKKTRLIISLLTALVFVFLGLKYFDSQKAEVEKIADTSKVTPVENPNPSAPVSIEAHCEAIARIPGAYPCNPSPDNKWIIYASDDGLKLIDVATGKTTVFSKSLYDRALVWFSDSQRVLGFVGSFPFSECGFNPPYDCPPDLRSIVIWDIKSETYDKVAVKTPPLSYDLEWIVPNHTARISARATDGTEGDSYYYTLDIDNKSVLLSGDYHWKPSLPAQAGLPPLVEAKRQAIYQAAISKDYDKLVVDFHGGDREFFEANNPDIISVLQMPFEFSPYIPASGPHSAIEARYTWPIDRGDLSQLRIVITEDGEWVYVGAGD